MEEKRTHVYVPSEFSYAIKQWQLTDILQRTSIHTGALSHAITLQCGEHGHELILQMQRLGLDAATCHGGSGGEGSRASVCSLSLSSSVTASFLEALKDFGLPQEVNVGGDS